MVDILRSERADAHRRIDTRPEPFVAVVALLAAIAPASLTGSEVIDVVQRVLLVAFVSYVGCHGRRLTWLIAGFVLAVPAAGASMLLALAGLAVLVAANVPRRRSRAIGAIGLGLSFNAALWYPADVGLLGPLAAGLAASLVVASGVRFVRSTKRRVVVGVAIATGIVVVVAGALASIAMVLAYRDVRDGSEAARRALAAARDGDGEAAAVSLFDAEEAFQGGGSIVDGPLAMPARLVPGLAQQVSAVQETVRQGTRIAEAGGDLIATADYDRLQYEGQLDLDQVRELAAPAARVDAVLDTAAVELADLAEGSLLPPLRNRIEDFDRQIASARRDARLASSLLEVTPGLFGADGDRRYLIIFMTPAELRGAGGFIGSYAELTATDGEVELSRSGRIADLIFAVPDGIRTISGPQDYLDRYGRFNPQDFLQDTTLSPHFPSSAQVIAELYPQSGGRPVDGVIGVTPTGLAALLELTGPVDVPGLDEPLTAANAVEVLTRSQYIDVPEDAERGDILTEATRVTFERLIDSSLPAPRRIARALSPATRSGHLRLWSPDSTEQDVFVQIGADGSLVLPERGDGFSVIQQNTGNNKLDAYLERTITYRPTVDVATGSLRATMRIELTNAVPTLDLPRAVVGNSRGAPVGTNISWLSVVTRHSVTSATLDGERLALGPGTERGLMAWDSPLIHIPPGETVVIEIQIEGSLDLREGYDLQILPQPVANADDMTVDLALRNGTLREDGSRGSTLLGDEPVTVPTSWSLELERS